MLILTKEFRFGLPLSKYLQKVNIGLKLATRLADETLEEIKVYRHNAEKTFSQIYTAALDIAGKFQVEIIVPRVIRRQVHCI